MSSVSSNSGGFELLGTIPGSLLAVKKRNIRACVKSLEDWSAELCYGSTFLFPNLTPSTRRVIIQTKSDLSNVHKSFEYSQNRVNLEFPEIRHCNLKLRTFTHKQLHIIKRISLSPLPEYPQYFRA